MPLIMLEFGNVDLQFSKYNHFFIFNLLYIYIYMCEILMQKRLV